MTCSRQPAHAKQCMAMHDLAEDDVPVLLQVIELMAAEITRLRGDGADHA